MSTKVIMTAIKKFKHNIYSELFFLTQKQRISKHRRVVPQPTTANPDTCSRFVTSSHHFHPQLDPHSTRDDYWIGRDNKLHN